MGLAQRHQLADEIQQGLRIGFLCGNRWPPGIDIQGEVEGLGIGGGGKAGIGGFGIPLHRRPGAGAVGAAAQHAAFLAGQAFDEAHADLVAVVDERHPRPGQQKRPDHPQLGHIARTAVGPLEIMVGRRDGDVPQPFRCIVVGSPVLVEIGERSLAAGIEEAGRMVERPFLVEEERGIAGRAEVDHEINVEARLDRLLRIAPFGDQHAVGILSAELVAEAVPQGRGRLAARIVLDQRRGHVDAETVAALFQPEGHDAFQLRQGGLGAWRRHRLFPGMCRIGLAIAIVERRLAVEEIGLVAAVALVLAGDKAARFHGLGIRPDVAVGKLVLRRLGRFGKPGMLVGGMSGDQVEDDLQTALVGFLEQPLGVGVGAVARSDPAEIADIVAGIGKGGIEDGVQPDGIDPERLDVVQPRDQSRQIANAIAIRILVALRIDLVDHRILQPGRHRRPHRVGGSGSGGGDQQGGEIEDPGFFHGNRLLWFANSASGFTPSAPHFSPQKTFSNLTMAWFRFVVAILSSFANLAGSFATYVLASLVLRFCHGPPCGQ